jgi:hypothetical protein
MLLRLCPCPNVRPDTRPVILFAHRPRQAAISRASITTYNAEAASTTARNGAENFDLESVNNSGERRFAVADRLHVVQSPLVIEINSIQDACRFAADEAPYRHDVDFLAMQAVPHHLAQPLLQLDVLVGPEEFE